MINMISRQSNMRSLAEAECIGVVRSMVGLKCDLAVQKVKIWVTWYIQSSQLSFMVTWHSEISPLSPYMLVTSSAAIHGWIQQWSLHNKEESVSTVVCTVSDDSHFVHSTPHLSLGRTCNQSWILADLELLFPLDQTVFMLEQSQFGIGVYLNSSYGVFFVSTNEWDVCVTPFKPSTQHQLRTLVGNSWTKSPLGEVFRCSRRCIDWLERYIGRWRGNTFSTKIQGKIFMYGLWQRSQSTKIVTCTGFYS